MASLDCLVHQVLQVSPDSPASQVYLEVKVNQDSQASGCQDPQGRKDSRVFPASRDPLADRADQEWTDSLDNQGFLDRRVSLALDFLALQVFQEYLDPKVSPDQREILASQAALVPQVGVVLMAVLDLKVNLEHLVFPELEAHLEIPFRALWESQAHLELQARSDHQVTLEETERKETPVHQV